MTIGMAIFWVLFKKDILLRFSELSFQSYTLSGINILFWPSGSYDLSNHSLWCSLCLRCKSCVVDVSTGVGYPTFSSFWLVVFLRNFFDEGVRAMLTSIYKFLELCSKKLYRSRKMIVLGAPLDSMVSVAMNGELVLQFA